MRVLAVPNWSFGRDRNLLHRFRAVLDGFELEVHFLQSDVDHNRTVSAFSGEASLVFSGLEKLSELAFDRIDLNRHVGVHPRIGALDVCPIVLLEGDAACLLRDVGAFANRLAAKFDLPVFLYEKSERGRHEADLPSLRNGGFGGLSERELHPDFGPWRPNPALGVSIVGVRDFLLAINVNLEQEDPQKAKSIAKQIRELRAGGDHRFLGVRAMGFGLSSKSMSQVSLNLTLPGITGVDPIVEWISAEAVRRGTRITSTELVGVIRKSDLAGATRLKPKASQIVEMGPEV